jgi:HlyD family secretion protein
MASLHESIVREDKIKTFRTPNQKRQRRIAIIVVAVVLLLAAGGYFLLVPREDVYRLSEFDTQVARRGDLAQITQASGTVTIPVTLGVLSPETGYAAVLMVEEGEVVAKDQLLARLDVPDLEDELEDLQANLQVKEQNLATSIQEDSFALQKLRKSLNYVEEDIFEAREEVTRMEQLVEINASRRSELETAEDQLKALLREREELVLDIEEKQVLSVLSQESQSASIELDRTTIQRLQQRISEASIGSPMDGEVLEIADELAVPGSLIVENEVLFSIADRSSAIVELEVSETYSGVLATGQTVLLTVSSQQLGGTITAVGKVAVASSDGIGSTVTVKVQPEGSPESLVPGATVVGELQVGEQKDVLYLPRGPYLTTGSQKYLYVVEGDTAIKREVSFGTVQGNDIEILRGVEAGEEVVVSGYQNYIEYKEIKLEEKDD